MVVVLIPFITSLQPFKSQELYQASAEQKAEADRLKEEGWQHFDKNKFKDAIVSFQTAIDIYRKIEDREGEARFLNNIGIVYHSQGKYDTAINYYIQSWKIAQKIDNNQVKMAILNNFGRVYLEQGDYNKVIEYSQQHLNIAKNVTNLREQGKALNHLGLAYYSISDYDKAIELHEQQLKIAEDIDDSVSKGKALNNLGIAYQAGAYYRKAIEYYEQYLAIPKELKNPRTQGNILGNLGLVYHSLGDYDKAIEYHKESLEIAQNLEDPMGKSEALDGLGLAYARQEKYEKAIESHNKSLEIAKNINYRYGQGVALNNLGTVYIRIGKYEEAIKKLKQRLEIAIALNNRRGQGKALSNIGLAFSSLGNYANAIENYQQSFKIAEEIEDRESQSIILSNMGLALLKSGKLAEAEKTILNSIKLRESIRKPLKDADKVSMFDTQVSPYLNLQQLFVAQNKFNEALEISERGRARAFVELLAKRFTGDNQQFDSQPPKIKDILKIAKAQNATLVEYSKVGLRDSDREKAALYIWVVKPTGEVTFRQVNLKSYRSLKDLVPDIRRSLSTRNPASISSTQQLTFAKGDLVRRKDDPEYVYEVVEVDSENGLLTLRISNGTPLPDPVPMTEVYKAESSRSNNAKLQQLHEILIDPIADLLPTNPEARVIFIPQGKLFLIPFPALQDNSGNYLIEKHTILTAPAIQVLDLTRSQRQRNGKQSNGHVLVVGNPTMPKSLQPLPYSEEEAFNIAQLYNTRPLIGSQATKAAIKSQLSNARIIHLATHGILNEDNALESAIALAPFSNDNGLLTANEILDLKLNGELFVLSACNTGKGSITGDGVIGLSRSLFIAGVPSVLVSLWTVNDESTAELMKEFYQNLKQGMDKAKALRQAMLKMMDKYPQPRNWAAFTLIGEAE
ncbi:CHAT domain-containing protein [Moorena producens]|uniref:CHAT domain-containing protein n=1 Tax=Moorena producens TaxID=1155739 RepID=UPI003C77A0DB